MENNETIHLEDLPNQSNRFTYGPALFVHETLPESLPEFDGDSPLKAAIAAAFRKLRGENATEDAKGQTEGVAYPLRGLVHIRKSTVQVATAPDEIEKYAIECIIDALVPCHVLFQPQNVLHPPKSESSTQLPAGYGQRFQVLLEKKALQDVTCAGDNATTEQLAPSFSIVASTVSDEVAAQEHTTFGVIVPTQTAPCGYQAKVLAQDIKMGTSTLRLSDIYGFPEPPVSTQETATSKRDNTENAQVDDDASACVVCLTEPKCSALFPCRHLCLCASCAQILKKQRNPDRRRCPVCRAHILSILIFEKTETL